MWNVKVEVVDPQGKVTLTNEYEYQTAEKARRCALDVLELLAETDHVSEFAAGLKFDES